MANKLREVRINKSLTQSQLAVLAKVGRSTISNIENEIYIPRVDIALNIAAALDCTVENLFFF